jgi:hypothetical protein
MLYVPFRFVLVLFAVEPPLTGTDANGILLAVLEYVMVVDVVLMRLYVPTKVLFVELVTDVEGTV